LFEEELRSRVTGSCRKETRVMVVMDRIVAKVTITLTKVCNNCFEKEGKRGEERDQDRNFGTTN